MLEQYRISDFIEWNNEKKLLLNPDFQRGSVWVPAARVYLIDTILRQLPVPKIYLRTKIDVERQVSVREVVDGQQRLKSILDFAADKIRLTPRAGEFDGLTYSTLPLDLKSTFLEYPLAVEQLLNADEDYVLEVFSRLNSYNVTLNPAEKRHAKYQGKFKWAVRQLSKDWSSLWSNYGLMSTRQRVRMEDDVTMAQLLMIASEGLQDGGSNKIDRYYKAKDGEYPEGDNASETVNEVLEVFIDRIAGILKGTKLATIPQFIVIFSALAHRLKGIPQGDIEGDMPPPNVGLGDSQTIEANMISLAAALEDEQPPSRFVTFVNRSASSTQRISSRQVRFRTFYSALGEQQI